MKKHFVFLRTQGLAKQFILFCALIFFGFGLYGQEKTPSDVTHQVSLNLTKPLYDSRLLPFDEDFLLGYRFKWNRIGFGVKGDYHFKSWLPQVDSGVNLTTTIIEEAQQYAVHFAFSYAIVDQTKFKLSSGPCISYHQETLKQRIETILDETQESLSSKNTGWGLSTDIQYFYQSQIVLRNKPSYPI